MPATFNNASFNYHGKELKVNKVKIEGASFSKESDFNYRVSGLVKVSIIKEEGEFEDLYSYTTEITVNKEDKIESCGKVYLNKLI